MHNWKQYMKVMARAIRIYKVTSLSPSITLIVNSPESRKYLAFEKLAKDKYLKG